MIKEIKSKINNSGYRRVGENFIALGLLNGIYFLSPLILIPYLMKTIGSELYGVYIFCWTFIYYFIFIVNYGFDYSTTREIAINRYDIDKVSDIYSTTFYTRHLLCIISIFILIFSTLFIDRLNTNWQLIILGIGVFIGQAFFPTWLFQGMEEMKFITIVNSIIRILPIFLVFLFVHSGDDINLIIFFQSISYLTGGAFSHLFAIRHFKIDFKKPELSKIKYNLKSGWSMFLSTVGISLYREVNTFMLGFITQNFEIVGFYALADKFIRLIQLLTNSVSQALFPYFGHKLYENREKTLRSFKQFGVYYSIFLLITSVLFYIFIPWIVEIYLNKKFPIIVRDVRIMSPIIFIGGLNYYFGIAGMVNLNHKTAFTIFVFIAGLLNILLCYFLGIRFEDIGASISIVFAELLLLLLILVYSQKKEKLFSSKIN